MTLIRGQGSGYAPGRGHDCLGEEAGKHAQEQPIGQDIWASDLGSNPEQLCHEMQDRTGSHVDIKLTIHLDLRDIRERQSREQRSLTYNFPA